MQAAPETSNLETAGSSHTQQLRERFDAVRGRSIELIATLSAEDCQIQSMPDASPAKWHLAHTTWFFETFLLRRFQPGYEVFDQQYGYLFNSYYNSVGQMHPRPQRGLLTRPSLDAVIDYRQSIDSQIQEWLSLCGEEQQEALDLLELGINHEQQHQELLVTDVLHAFSRNPLRPAVFESYPLMTTDTDISLSQNWISLEPGLIEFGHRGLGFAFDNEGPRHKQWLEPCEVAVNLVTNHEYLAFIEDGGYASPLLWASDGWAKVQQYGWSAPLYWDLPAGTEFGLSGEQELVPTAAVSQLSWYEADAYARWAGARLPTEFEWEQAVVLHNLNDAFGKVWQWTASPYSAYPGFSPAPGAVGEYNGKFMCNQYVLRGSSMATAAGHSRSTYRNFFYPDARWQFSGLRLARDL